MIDRDAVAQKVYGATYNALSTWGKLQVDHIHEMQAAKVPAPVTLNDVNTAADTQRLATRVRILEEENADLWEENTELRNQNATMRQELHLPEDDTSL